MYLSPHVVFDENNFPFKPPITAATFPDLMLSKFPSLDEWFDSPTQATKNSKIFEQSESSKIKNYEHLDTLKLSSIDYCDYDIVLGSLHDPPPIIPGNLEQISLETSSESIVDSITSNAIPVLDPFGNESPLSISPVGLHQQENTNLDLINQNTSHPIRSRRPPAYLQDYVALAINSSPTSLPSEPKTLKIAVKDPR